MDGAWTVAGRWLLILTCSCTPLWGTLKHVLYWAVHPCAPAGSRGSPSPPAPARCWPAASCGAVQQGDGTRVGRRGGRVGRQRMPAASCHGRTGIRTARPFLSESGNTLCCRRAAATHLNRNERYSQYSRSGCCCSAAAAAAATAPPGPTATALPPGVSGAAWCALPDSTT